MAGTTDLHFPYHRSITSISKIMLPFFESHFPPLKKSSCLYKKHSDDFGVEIKKLLMSKNIQGISSRENPSNIASTLENMRLIGNDLDIEIHLSSEACHPRDIWIRTPDGAILNQKNSFSFFLRKQAPEKFDQALIRAIDLSIFYQSTGFARSKNFFLRAVPDNFYGASSFISEDEKSYFNTDQKRLLAFCGEGGNILKLTNQEGNTKILVGEFLFFTTLNAYLLEKNIIEKAYHTPFSQELIKNNLVKLQENEILQLAQEMAVQGILNPHDLETSDPEKLRNPVAIYAWQKLYIQVLISATFNVPHEDLIFIPQVYYHLDNFLKSGPYHCVLVASHELTARLLEEILTHSKELQLSPKDIKNLTIYIQTAWKLDQELGPLLTKTHNQLEKGGFKVIPIPALFMYENPPDAPLILGNVNFLNAVSGWSHKKQGYYYLTTGAQVGDQLGLIFMDLFNLLLKTLEPNLEVYFLGRIPQHLEDFSEPMIWWNTFLAQFGIHCLTFELETEAHQA